MSCMVQVALQINIWQFAESIEVLRWLKSEPTSCKYQLWQTICVLLCLQSAECKWSSSVNVSLLCHTCDDCITKTHNNEISAKAPEFLVILFIEKANLSSLQQLPWRQGKIPKLLGLYSTWVHTHYLSPQLLGNTAHPVDGWLHIFRIVVNYADIDIIFIYQPPFPPVPFQSPCKSSLVPRSGWSFVFFWRLCLCCL